MRSLGVIFLADVVGYSKMMAEDETGALNLIREFQKEIIRPTLTRYNGKMIKSLGNGGGGGIRTHGRLSPTSVFKTGAFNHSATPPT